MQKPPTLNLENKISDLEIGLWNRSDDELEEMNLGLEYLLESIPEADEKVGQGGVQDISAGKEKEDTEEKSTLKDLKKTDKILWVTGGLGAVMVIAWVASMALVGLPFLALPLLGVGCMFAIAAFLSYKFMRPKYEEKERRILKHFGQRIMKEYEIEFQKSSSSKQKDEKIEELQEKERPKNYLIQYQKWVRGVIATRNLKKLLEDALRNESDEGTKKSIAGMLKDLDCARKEELELVLLTKKIKKTPKPAKEQVVKTKPANEQVAKLSQEQEKSWTESLASREGYLKAFEQKMHTFQNPVKTQSKSLP